VVSFADRIAYCAHDLEDAIKAGIVTVKELPQVVTEVAGTDRRTQLSVFIRCVIDTTCATGRVGMAADVAEALAALRAFNYERIYTRRESLGQAEAVVEVLHGLVAYYQGHIDQVRCHDVGVPLDDDGLALLADVGPGQVQSVQDM
jgi:dGTPase